MSLWLLFVVFVGGGFELQQRPLGIAHSMMGPEWSPEEIVVVLVVVVIAGVDVVVVKWTRVKRA